MKKDNYFDIIKKDFIFLKSSAHSIFPGLIGNVICCIDEKKRFIGKHIGNVSLDNYTSMLETIFNDSHYAISLSDGSLICSCYSFDEACNLCSFSISFLPNTESDELFSNGSNFFHGEYYFRIDYEPNSYVENTHPKIHLHQTMDRKCIRIPVARVILLSDFLYFVLKNIYGERELSTFKKEVAKKRKEMPSDIFLSDDELSSFYII